MWSIGYQCFVSRSRQHLASCVAISQQILVICLAMGLEVPDSYVCQHLFCCARPFRSIQTQETTHFHSLQASCLWIHSLVVQTLSQQLQLTSGCVAPLVRAGQANYCCSWIFSTGAALAQALYLQIVAQ